MSESDSEPGAQLDEEPQEERGELGSRDEGSDEPDAGTPERPVGTSDASDSTGVNPLEPIDPDSPTPHAGL
jgi:hypothetical protein